MVNKLFFQKAFGAFWGQNKTSRSSWQVSEELMALDWQRELLCLGEPLSEQRLGGAKGGT